MNTRYEKVMQGLKTCETSGTREECKKCPYYNLPDDQCADVLMKDASEFITDLIKEYKIDLTVAKRN